MIRQQQEAGDVIRVVLERILQRIKHLLAVAWSEGSRQSVMKIGVLRKSPQPLGESFRGKLEIALVQRELSAGHVGVAILGVALLRAVEELFQHLARVGVQQDGGAPERHQARRILKGP